MKPIEFRPGQTYLVDDQKVTFICLETKDWRKVARVIPQTEHNPAESEPVEALLVSPKKLMEVPRPLPA